MDLVHLAEEIDDVGKSVQRELASRLRHSSGSMAAGISLVMVVALNLIFR